MSSQYLQPVPPREALGVTPATPMDASECAQHSRDFCGHIPVEGKPQAA